MGADGPIRDTFTVTSLELWKCENIVTDYVLYYPGTSIVLASQTVIESHGEDKKIASDGLPNEYIWDYVTADGEISDRIGYEIEDYAERIGWGSDCEVAW